jgi:hypothetical protein
MEAALPFLFLLFLGMEQAAKLADNTWVYLRAKDRIVRAVLRNDARPNVSLRKRGTVCHFQLS